MPICTVPEPWNRNFICKSNVREISIKMNQLDWKQKRTTKQTQSPVGCDRRLKIKVGHSRQTKHFCEPGLYKSRPQYEEFAKCAANLIRTYVCTDFSKTS